MDATQELIAIAGRQAREIAERDELLARAAEALEHNVAALERAATQSEALRRLSGFIFAEPAMDDLAFYRERFMRAN